MDRMDRSIYADNAYHVDQPLTARQPADNSKGPATGLTVTAHISATEGGVPIHTDLLINLTESPAGSGEYVGDIPGASITLRMFSGGAWYDRLPCWLVFKDSTGALNLSRPRTAYRYRTS